MTPDVQVFKNSAGERVGHAYQRWHITNGGGTHHMDGTLRPTGAVLTVDHGKTKPGECKHFDYIGGAEIGKRTIYDIPGGEFCLQRIGNHDFSIQN